MAARRRGESVVVGVNLHFLVKEVEFSSFRCIFGYLKWDHLCNYLMTIILSYQKTTTLGEGGAFKAPIVNASVIAHMIKHID